MLDISSTTKTSTCTNTTTTNAYLRSVLNEIGAYRGTTYTYPQKTIVSLVASCLEELGFNVTVDNSTNYYNHIVLNDYGEDVCLQMFHIAGASCSVAFLYPRHVSAYFAFGSTFNTSTNCHATIRMLGEGPGKTKTMLMFGGGVTPPLTTVQCIYFTEAKYLPTGEMKKAIVVQNTNYAYYFCIFDSDWTFLPGFDSTLNTVGPANNWYMLSVSNGNRCANDPYVSYKLFQEQNYFPEIPVASDNAFWEFPDVIYQPYGQVNEADTLDTLKYNLTAGNIYQIGDKKYLCNGNGGYKHFLFRVE